MQSSMMPPSSLSSTLRLDLYLCLSPSFSTASASRDAGSILSRNPSAPGPTNLSNGQRGSDESDARNSRRLHHVAYVEEPGGGANVVVLLDCQRLSAGSRDRRRADGPAPPATFAELLPLYSRGMS